MRNASVWLAIVKSIVPYLPTSSWTTSSLPLFIMYLWAKFRLTDICVWFVTSQGTPHANEWFAAFQGVFMRAAWGVLWNVAKLTQNLRYFVTPYANEWFATFQGTPHANEWFATFQDTPHANEWFATFQGTPHACSMRGALKHCKPSINVCKPQMWLL